MKSDACSGMITQMNALSTTVNGFSSSINDHETRIQGLEASSGGLYKAASYDGWADLYMPSTTTGTFCRVHIHATNETFYANQHGTSVIFGIYGLGWQINQNTTLVSSYPASLRAGRTNTSGINMYGIYVESETGSPVTINANVFNGIYTINSLVHT